MPIRIEKENGDFSIEIGGRVTLRPGSRIAVRADGTIEVVGIHIEPEPA